MGTPQTLCGPTRSTFTSINDPMQLAVAGKLTTVLPLVLPQYSPARRVSNVLTVAGGTVTASASEVSEAR